MTTQQLVKIEKAYKHGSTTPQAAAYAKCSELELMEKIGSDPEWYAACQQSKLVSTVQSLINLGESVEQGNIEDSKYLLERKLPDEFGKKITSKHEGELTWNIVNALPKPPCQK